MCSICRRTVIAEEFESHECRFPLTELREAEAAFWWTTEHGSKRTLNVRTLDGILYFRVEKEKRGIDASTESKQEDYSEWLNHHPT
jgi:hypothetical protein